jgi:hypothetical protein
VQCPEWQRWRGDILNNKWPHIKKDVASRKIFTAKNVTEQRNLGAIAYEIKCKWENHVKKAELGCGGEEEVDCM